MAVEARHLNLFPPQFLANREIMNGIDVSANMYGAPIGYGGGLPPLSGTTTENLLPVYGSDSVPADKTHRAMKSDSGLTYNLPVSRKRTRDSINPSIAFPNNQNQNHLNRCGGSFTFLGEDISLQIQHQQLEIDHFIAQHTEKVRLELEERRKRNSRRIIAAFEDGIVKRLRAKEEEIDKIGKLNWALEEKVKSLYIENQIWRDLAQTNEATANALRSNLEQVLAHVQDEQYYRTGENNAADAESCCGSNYDINDEPRLENGGERKVENDYGTSNDTDGTTSSRIHNSNRLCRNCGKVESCVLLLPCRHLCLCTVCGSSLHTCPICKSTKNASVHVNM